MRTPLLLTTLCSATLAACLVDTATYSPASPSSDECGNGVLDPGEECDYGAQNSDSGACLLSCRLATCGDGYVNPAYEQCDDGNKTTEVCEYGVTSCTVCDATCQEVSGKTSICGDGITDPDTESCDDRNLSCGTCNSECQGPAWWPATGYIHAARGSDLADASDGTFTLDDGFNEPVTFQFWIAGQNVSMPQSPAVKLGSPNGWIRITVRAYWSEERVAKAIADRINDQAPYLFISAVADQDYVWLTHSMATEQGYKDIINNVNAGSFWVSGMYGGSGEDCQVDQPCNSNNDCETHICISGVCTGGG